jgi:hypothetical protein
VAIREKLCKRNRTFVENDQSTLWNYCMRYIHCKLHSIIGKQQTQSSFWFPSTLSAMWIEKFQGLKHKKMLRQNLIPHRICPRMLATEIVFIPILYHSPCKCSATIVIALGNDFYLQFSGRKLYFQSVLWSFSSTNMRFVLYSFYVTFETYSNVLIIFDWFEFLYESLLWPFDA